MWHALLYVLAYHAVGILVYGHLENWGPLDTSYFLTVTATTVGYGDLTPQSDAGKAFTVVYALLGVFLVFDVLTSLFADVVKNTAWREGLLDWWAPDASASALSPALGGARKAGLSPRAPFSTPSQRGSISSPAAARIACDGADVSL